MQAFTIIQNLKPNKLTIQNVTIDGGCPVVGLGGGIYNSAALTLIGVTVYGNKAGLGGGIYNDGSLTIVGGKILNNSATGVSGGQCSLGGGVTGFGGGLYNTGTAVLSNVTVSGNTAVSTGCNSGAGIFNTNAGTIHVIGSTISNNSAQTVSSAAASGGGIFNFDGKVFLDSTVVSGNTAVSVGGGIANLDLLDIRNNSTISGNSSNFSNGWGGGIYNSNNANATISGPTAITNNAAAQGAGIYNYGPGGTPGSVKFFTNKGAVALSSNTPDQCGGTGTYTGATSTGSCPH